MITDRRSSIRGALSAIVLAAMAAFSTSSLAFDEVTAAALDAAIGGEHRPAEARARDGARKPRETLDFLGFRSDMTVVEVWPGTGWYTQILAPALKERGTFYAAQYSPNPRYGYQRRYFGRFLTMLGENPNLYRQVKVTHLALPYELRLAPPGSADMVVTFRNVHNWFAEGYGGGRYVHLGFQAMYDALKPARRERLYLQRAHHRRRASRGVRAHRGIGHPREPERHARPPPGRVEPAPEPRVR